MSETTEVIADEDQILLRFNIDGDWSASEFSSLLSDVSFVVSVWVSLHGLDGDEPRVLSPIAARLVEEAENADDPELAAGIERQALSQLFKLRPPFTDDDVHALLFERPDLGLFEALDRAKELFPASFSIEVERIRFESPGLIDLGGFGKIAGHIKDFLLRLIDLYVYTRDRDINRELAMQKVVSARIKNAEKILDLGDRLGLDQHTKTALMLDFIRTGHRLSDLERSHKLLSIKTIKE